ncbi:unnamed protein product [Rotaria magnacalcarata]|uniref:Uncharacterized protein n=1 Tax=Rotaria magnacalcarata TaxID=392030 RepID=A0A816TQR9_9BILA|nr:unnamed protein product [Rotaria magnacalcarata]CAF1653261.1 unnamed protein product [Rotaria magnacalcarata]CAF2035914.1 unnamed protein product [Rotaria magnacalcarata]CAF2037364.1 unnamed protein product [Rotaria magnacalcarata]CAF2098378.1 unnamed protein product [Rotaria magnacalcarata]
MRLNIEDNKQHVASSLCKRIHAAKLIKYLVTEKHSLLDAIEDDFNSRELNSKTITTEEEEKLNFPLEKVKFHLNTVMFNLNWFLGKNMVEYQVMVMVMEIIMKKMKI